jgi:hypothetical protein
MFKHTAMIPAIILMLIRRYQKNYPQQFLILKTQLFYTARIILMMVIVFLIALITRAQEKHLNYSIKRNGSTIGSMLVKEIKDGKTIRLKLESNIKTGFIFAFSAIGIEEAKYDNGVLVYSSVYQKLNGNEKLNKQIRYANNSYVVSNKGREQKLYNVKIGYNLVCIYNHEPVNTSLIFSDKYQKFLPIQKIQDHHYRIKFPDGSGNDYWFENGVCKKIEIDHTFYSAVMELNQ